MKKDTIYDIAQEYYSDDIDTLAAKLSVAPATTVNWVLRELRYRTTVLKAKRAADKKSRKRKVRK